MSRTLWHEVLPGVLGDATRVCHHRVLRETPLYLVIESACDPRRAEGDTRLRHDEMATGVGVDAMVVRREQGARRPYVAFFFEGPVPSVPLRPPGWLRERRRAEAARRAEQAQARDAAPPPPPPPAEPARPRKPTARDAVKAVAARFVEALCPWSTGWRLTTARPHPAGRPLHHAMVAVKRTNGTEHVVVEAEGRDEAEALRLLSEAMEARLKMKAGVPFPEYEQAAPRRPGSASHGASPEDLEALGLSTLPDTVEALQKARKAAILATHPDRGGTSEAFQRVEAAAERLRALLVE